LKARKPPSPAETETGGECRVFWYVSEAQKLGISCRISRIQKQGRNTQISDRNPEISVADGKFLLPAPPYGRVATGDPAEEAKLWSVGALLEVRHAAQRNLSQPIKPRRRESL
jgi:hypothetical protein